jgi:phosphohistidine phosphatase
MRGTRRLIVMRHAKAGELPGGPDFERALTERGRQDAAAAGQWLREADLRPDEVLCSAARRTRQTWQCVAEALGGTVSMTAEQALYEADAGQVAELIRQAPDQVGTLMYVGHNPAAVELVALLTGEEPARFPTSAIAVIAPAASWPELGAGEARLMECWTPRG